MANRKYVGWIPNVSGTLSFESIGPTTHPSPSEFLYHRLPAPAESSTETGQPSGHPGTSPKHCGGEIVVASQLRLLSDALFIKFAPHMWARRSKKAPPMLFVLAGVCCREHREGGMPSFNGTIAIYTHAELNPSKFSKDAFRAIRTCRQAIKSAEKDKGHAKNGGKQSSNEKLEKPWPKQGCCAIYDKSAGGDDTENGKNDQSRCLLISNDRVFDAFGCACGVARQNCSAYQKVNKAKTQYPDTKPNCVINFTLSSDGTVTLENNMEASSRGWNQGNHNIEFEKVAIDQAFFFLKDVTHTHQHHDPHADELTRPHDTSVCDWREETFRILLSHIDRERERKSLRCLLQAKGMMQYLSSFVKICRKKKDGKVSALDSFNEKNFENVINIDIDAKEKRRTVVQAWVAYLVAPIISGVALVSAYMNLYIRFYMDADRSIEENATVGHANDFLEFISTSETFFLFVLIVPLGITLIYVFGPLLSRVSICSGVLGLLSRFLGGWKKILQRVLLAFKPVVAGFVLAIVFLLLLNVSAVVLANGSWLVPIATEIRDLINENVWAPLFEWFEPWVMIVFQWFGG